MLHSEDSFLGTWDVFMLGIIGYSCFTSAYYLTFKMTVDFYLLRIEDVTYVIFGLDIFFNFFRIYKDKNGVEMRSHYDIAKNYLGGTLIIDLISTFPFYLLPNIQLNLKIIRLFRLARIVKIFD